MTALPQLVEELSGLPELNLECGISQRAEQVVRGRVCFLACKHSLSQRCTFAGGPSAKASRIHLLPLTCVVEPRQDHRVFGAGHIV